MTQQRDLPVLACLPAKGAAAAGIHTVCQASTRSANLPPEQTLSFTADLLTYKATCILRHVQMTFANTRDKLLPRPWARDDIDRIIHRWQEQPHSKALIFVDNAGSDIILGDAAWWYRLCLSSVQ